MRNKKFSRYLINHSYPIAIDGTQKFKRDKIWSEECSGRTVGKGDKARPQYYVYVLEASLVFHNGMVIPLMSEFLEYTKGDTSEKKEDCETKAFKRLATRLKKEFKRLRIMILLDGLYPNGPIMEICRKNKWDFMIVLQDKSLRSVWDEFYGLLQLQSDQKVNIHARCNLAARHRWGIEANILIEKRHGYQYEHCFSYDWNAMKGYHYLMHLAHLINVLAEYSESLAVYIKENGIRNLIRFILNTISGPWLQGDIEKRIMAPCQLRLL